MDSAPVKKRRKTLTLLVIITSLILLSAIVRWLNPQDDGQQWQGMWNTNWNGGGAEMILQYEGDRVFGQYQPYNGIIEATVKGHLIEGTWEQGGMTGSLVFNLAADGQSFFGRFDSGEWWNGEKRSDDTAFKEVLIERKTPSISLRNYLQSFNRLQAGEYYLAHTALNYLHFDDETISERNKFLRAKKFFYLLDQFTFQVWGIEPPADAQSFSHTLNSSTLNVQFDLQFTHRKEGWFIQAPEQKILDAFFHDNQLNYAIISNNTDFLELRSPRDALRSFLEIMDGRSNLHMDATDTFEKDNTDRDFQGDILAEYLKHTLDKISHVVYQEIPNNPDLSRPYVFFDHAIGDVTLVPIDDEINGRQWRFSKDTLAQIRKLYNSFDNIDAVQGLGDKDNGDVMMFKVRALLAKVTPLLVETTLGMENWQWVCIPLLLLFSGTLIDLCRRIPVQIVQRLLPQRIPESESQQFIFPLTIITLSTLWVIVFTLLGINQKMTNVATSLGVILISLAGLRIMFLAINLFRELVFTHNDAFQGTNKIYATLFIGLLKVLAGFMTFFICTDALGIKLETILAGLGIFGFAVAFAARETIGNIFGSIIVLMDRPFKAGDTVRVGDIKGKVEMVGIRSTRMITSDDTRMVIPNGLFSREAVENITEMAYRHSEIILHIFSKASIQELQITLDKIRALLHEDALILDGCFVGFCDVSDKGIELKIKYKLDTIAEAEYAEHRHHLICNIIGQLEEDDIAIKTKGD